MPHQLLDERLILQHGPSHLPEALDCLVQGDGQLRGQISCTHGARSIHAAVAMHQDSAIAPRQLALDESASSLRHGDDVEPPAVVGAQDQLVDCSPRNASIVSDTNAASVVLAPSACSTVLGAATRHASCMASSRRTATLIAVKVFADGSTIDFVSTSSTASHTSLWWSRTRTSCSFRLARAFRSCISPCSVAIRCLARSSFMDTRLLQTTTTGSSGLPPTSSPFVSHQHRAVSLGGLSHAIASHRRS